MRVAPVWLAGYAGVILLVIVLANLAAQLGRFSYGIILPSMHDSLGLSHTQEGSLITVLSILSILASLVFGMLAPRLGSRLVVSVSAIAAGLALIFLGTSPNFLFAMVMTAIVGFAVGGCTTVSMGMLPMWFDSRNRGTAAGLAAAGGGLSFVIAGVLISSLTDRDPVDGWRHTWYILGAIVIVAGLFSLAFLRDRPKVAGEAAQRGAGAWPIDAYKNAMVWLMSILAFCNGWSMGLYITFFGLHLEEQGISLAASGRLWTLLGVLAIGSGLIWGYVADKMGRRAAFMLSFGIYAVGCLLFWATPVLAGFIVSVVLVGASLLAAYTVCATAAGDYVLPRFAAAAFGLMGMGAGLGMAIGPVIGGSIADATDNLGLVFLLGTGASVIACFGAMLLRRPGPSPA